MALFATSILLARLIEPNPFALLGYQTVNALLNGKPIPTPTTKTASKGVFVTIESGGKVVGCRGTLEPSTSTLELEVQKAARQAAQFDPRYGKVNLQGRSFAVTVTIVQRQETISSVVSLTPSQGLVLVSNRGTGIVLPWEGKDPNTRLSWAYKKANTPQGTPVSLKRLFADRYRYPEL